MSVFKEGYYALAQIVKASVHIYPDAADFGAPTKKGDALWIAAQMAAEMYGNPTTKIHNRYTTGRSCEINIELMDEWVTGNEEVFNLSFVSCTDGKCKGFDGYLRVYTNSMSGHETIERFCAKIK